jgi:DNA modification methylase
MPKRPFVNRLNDLHPKEWIKFQKSWFVHNPPPRRRDVLRHPGKFPESLIQEFIEFFTKSGQLVLDPMAGTGSTLVAALRTGRHSYGIELNPEYADLARKIIAEERASLGDAALPITAEVITGDASQAVYLLTGRRVPIFNYVITSPPYWNMLHAKGAETQHTRRLSQVMDVVYSQDPNDLGNIEEYEAFLERLAEIYRGLQPRLAEGAYLTIIVKNIKKKGQIYPLAWDLARSLKDTYTLKDEKIWCQDDQRLAPYGIGNAWVSNTFHHYCLQFRNEP